jgi:MoaA/NifB/PqqE/SkfB family radical SAM enzyme
MLATWHFHIEISSKCTLRCPRCARQEVPNGLVNTELNLEFFKRNFTPKFILNNVEKITFCGDDGDPIYAHDLIPVIRYIKSVKPVEIVIVTNGSHKKTEWWQELGSVLTDTDTVHFSIDGWNDESNNLYSVNSDFTSILKGVASLRSTSACRTVWAAIVFKFNEDHLLTIVSTAESHGFDAVQFTKSTKFGTIYPGYGNNDPLEPGKKFVSSSHRFERDVILLSSRGLNSQINEKNIKLYKSVNEINNVKPLCEIGNKGLYIDAQGRLFPCCWVANRYSHNSEWKDIANKFDLNRRTLSDAVTDVVSDAVECCSKCFSERCSERCSE